MMHPTPDRALGPSPTFFVDADRQKKNLAEFKRRDQQLAEAYHKNRPLCFNAQSFQRTHPAKAANGHKDADATLQGPLILGVADGVSQIEDFGMDAALLPNELLQVCERLAMRQLIPDFNNQDTYDGPIPLLRRSFEATQSLGSLTVVLAIMDNNSRIHGKRHPMVAIVTVGDCELVILRRVQGKMSPLQSICHTEMQRIDGHAQTPLQLARVDGRIDENFHDGITIDVIERGSAVHCVSAYEGDIVLMGSDGVFDNLFLDEITALCNTMLPPGGQGPISDALLARLAEDIIWACHAKTKPGANGLLPDAPIGRGGKKDDTSVVVAEVVQWTEAHHERFAPRRSAAGAGVGRRGVGQTWSALLGRLQSFADPLDGCCAALGYHSADEDDEVESRPSATKAPAAVLREAEAAGSDYGCPYEAVADPLAPLLAGEAAAQGTSVRSVRVGESPAMFSGGAVGGPAVGYGYGPGAFRGPLPGGPCAPAGSFAQLPTSAAGSFAQLPLLAAQPPPLAAQGFGATVAGARPFAGVGGPGGYGGVGGPPSMRHSWPPPRPRQ